MSKALSFIGDMKLGHYLKVPPQVMFTAQAVAAVWSVFVQTAVFYCKLSKQLHT